MKITAEHREHGGTSVLAKPRTLKGAARKIEQECEFWSWVGWEGVTLEGVNQTEIRKAFWDGKLTREEMRLLCSVAVG